MKKWKLGSGFHHVVRVNRVKNWYQRIFREVMVGMEWQGSWGEGLTGCQVKVLREREGGVTLLGDNQVGRRNWLSENE